MGAGVSTMVVGTPGAEVEMMVVGAVGPTEMVELETDQWGVLVAEVVLLAAELVMMLLEAEVVEERRGQLVTVGLHSVMVRVLVMVDVRVVVPETS